MSNIKLSADYRSCVLALVNSIPGMFFKLFETSYKKERTYFKVSHLILGKTQLQEKSHPTQPNFLVDLGKSVFEIKRGLWLPF